MKRFIKLMSVVLLLGAVATANTGGNPEVTVEKTNPTDTNYCDPLQRFLGLCRSTNDILEEN